MSQRFSKLFTYFTLTVLGGGLLSFAIVNATLTLDSTSLTSDGALTLKSASSSAINFGHPDQSGTITIASTTQALTLDIGKSTSALTISIGSGTGGHTVNIATGTSTAKTVNIGTGANVANTINIGSASSSLALSSTNWTISTAGTSTLRRNTVTSLPASPSDGDEVYYLADATNGVVWHLRYNAGSASAYKWEYLGGPPLTSEVAATDNIASVTYVAIASAGPAITLPRAGDYDIEIGAHFAVGKNSSIARMSYDIGATGAVDADSIEATSAVVASGQLYDYMAVARTQRKTGLGAVTLTAKYLSGDATASAYYARYRFMRVTPVRVQ